ncbi:unnamed protein product, partial [Amoebophrya sp. A25]
ETLRKRYGNEWGTNPKTKDVDLTLVLRNFDRFKNEHVVLPPVRQREAAALEDKPRPTAQQLAEVKRSMLMDVFYAKLTDAIYPMHFKKELQERVNLKRFTNAALKMTEVLCKEDLCRCSGSRRSGSTGGAREGVATGGASSSSSSSSSSSTTFTHFANAELPGSFLCAVNCHLRLHWSVAGERKRRYALDNGKEEVSVYEHYSWYGNSLLPGDMGPNSPGLPDYFLFHEQYPERWLMREPFEDQVNRLLHTIPRAAQNSGTSVGSVCNVIDEREAYPLLAAGLEKWTVVLFGNKEVEEQQERTSSSSTWTLKVHMKIDSSESSSEVVAADLRSRVAREV